MNYRVIFEKKGALSVNQLAQIFNAINPTDIIGTQQSVDKLLCNLVFSREVSKEEINDLLKKSTLTFATCISCNKVNEFEVFIKE